MVVNFLVIAPKKDLASSSIPDRGFTKAKVVLKKRINGSNTLIKFLFVLRANNPSS
jgi:hypothetical protein